MKRIDHPTANNSLFTEGNPASGVPATNIIAEWLNNVQEEICAVIEDSDGGNATLNGSSQTQLKDAIIALIAASGGGGGGSGDANGFHKVSAFTSNADSSTTNTSNAVSNISTVFTPITGTRKRLVTAFLDVELQDAAGPAVEGIYTLERSIDGGSYTTLKEFTIKDSVTSGQLLVKTQKASLASDAVSTSGSNATTGLQLNYTPINGNNKRLVQLAGQHRMDDNNGIGAHGTLVLEYFNGSVWTTVKEFKNQGIHGGSNSAAQEMSMFFEYEDETNDASPQYRVSHRALDTGDESTLFAGSFLNVKEFANLAVGSKRSFILHEVQDDADASSNVTYRVAHRVANGDTSILKTGSGILVKEVG